MRVIGECYPSVGAALGHWVQRGDRTARILRPRTQERISRAFMPENARIPANDDGRIFDMAGREATIEDLHSVEGKAEIC